MKPLLAFAILALAAHHAHADTDVRKVTSFTGIEIAGMVVVKATINSTTKVEVQGDADLLKLVSTTVKNGVLVLETPKDFAKSIKRKNAKLEVIVSAPDISRVSISGVGTLTLAGLASKSLDVTIGGTGSMKLEGKTQKLRLDVGGTGEVHAKSLVADSVDVKIDGTAEASLNATKSFESNVDGTAALNVRGKPASVKKHGHGVVAINI